MDKDCINHSAQAPHRQNRQHPSLRQCQINRYLGYNQAERGLQSNQIRRQTTRDRYPQETQHMLQRIEH